MLRLCTGYETPAGMLEFPPADTEQLATCRPRYEEMPGWTEPLGSVRRFADLPATARAYIARIAEVAGGRIQAVSVGSSRTSIVRVPAKL